VNLEGSKGSLNVSVRRAERDGKLGLDAKALLVHIVERCNLFRDRKVTFEVIDSFVARLILCRSFSILDV
jgi:hypothetical protein